MALKDRRDRLVQILQDHQVQIRRGLHQDLRVQKFLQVLHHVRPVLRVQKGETLPCKITPVH
ncbi:hypothetical protein D3C75_1257510 [compost metagenome]